MTLPLLNADFSYSVQIYDEQSRKTVKNNPSQLNIFARRESGVLKFGLFSLISSIS